MTLYCEGYNHYFDESELAKFGLGSYEELKTFYGILCPRHLATEFFRCEKCLEKGYVRYDSLVLCEKHSKGMDEIIQKLNDAIHEPFRKAEDESHEHNYVSYEEPKHFVKRKCSICGYIEPIVIVTRLIE